MYEIMKTWKLSLPPNWKYLEEYENVTAFFLSIHPNKKYENMKTYFLSDPIENVWNYENMKTFFPTQLKIPRRVWKYDSFLFIYPP